MACSLQVDSDRRYGNRGKGVPYRCRFSNRTAAALDPHSRTSRRLEQHQGCQCKSKDLFGVHFLNSFSKKYSNNQPSGAKTPPLSRKGRRNRRWIAQLYPVPEALMRKQVSRLGIILLKPLPALRQWYRLFCPLYGYWDSPEFASVFPRRGLPRRRLSTRIRTLFVCGHTISVSSPDVKAAKPALSVFYQKAPVFF